MSEHEQRIPMSVQTDGRAIRALVPRSSHGEWLATSEVRDPVSIVTSQNASRLQFLVPIRHWRMSQSPFTFYRGAAKLMAFDLASTPDSGLYAQICGDAHLSNFGVYGSPERDLVFDLNDFDETLAGPWEWDVKRLAASFVIAARHKGLGDDLGADLAQRSAEVYRTTMREFASAGYLDAWYAHVTTDDIYAAFKSQVSKTERKQSKKFVRKARGKDSLRAFSKLAELVDGEYRIAAQPPLIIPLRDIPENAGVDAEGFVRESFRQYFDSVSDHLEPLLARFTFKDLAVKVVGVGSVGTRCAIVLLEGRDAEDPLFLQIKEAGRSVLEDHLPPSPYAHAGQRVVVGQRIMQASSDSFLGWTRDERVNVDYYWRQLKDMKSSFEVDTASVDAMGRFAQLCGWTLARAHARSGDAGAIGGYLGGGSAFDDAIGRFSVAYADQNDLDYARFRAAIESGEIPAHE